MMNKEIKTMGTLTVMLFCSAILISCSKEETTPKDGQGTGTPYITKVLDYVPGPGQFVNVMPEFQEGDTQEKMNAKVLAAIGNNNKQTITLGGFGGYVTVGFDHTIENVKGKRDFKVLGNAFSGKGTEPGNNVSSGSFEPGIIMVAYDKNKNGKPDTDEWYEIYGSAHKGEETWYKELESAGNDINLYKDYEITYYKPTDNAVKDIKWTDNKGKEGVIEANQFHQQPYFPQWIEGSKLKFKGTRLPQNGINKGTDEAPYFALYSFSYGYADNAVNDSEGAEIDIDWAMDSTGQPANLPGVDFIKIYTGVNQVNGWLGECSTEVSGIEDLHLINK